MAILEKIQTATGYLLRIVYGLGDGFYWGASTILLAFGVYFSPLTGGLSLLVPAFAAFCSVFMVIQNIREEKRERAALLTAKLDRQKINEECEQLETENKYPKAVLTNENISFKARSWILLKRLLTRTREFLNSAKNGARIAWVLVIAALFIAGIGGINVAAGGIIAAGPVVLGLAVVGVIGFGILGVIDYHRRRVRKRKIEALEDERRILEEECFRLKNDLPQDPRDAENSQNQYPGYVPTIGKKISNGLKLGLRFFTGTIHGGYLGFAITVAVFGLVLMPLSVINPIAAMAVPLVLAGIMLLYQTGRHFNVERAEQEKERLARHNLAIQQQKIEELKTLHPEFNYPDFKAAYDAKHNPPAESTLGKKAHHLLSQIWQATLEGFVQIRETSRGLRNSVKFVIGFVITVGALTSMPFISAGWPVFAGMAGCMLFFGALTIVENRIISQREKKIKMLANEAKSVTDERRALQLAIKQTQIDVPEEGTAIPTQEPHSLNVSTPGEVLASETEVATEDEDIEAYIKSPIDLTKRDEKQTPLPSILPQPQQPVTESTLSSSYGLVGSALSKGEDANTGVNDIVTVTPVFTQVKPQLPYLTQQPTFESLPDDAAHYIPSVPGTLVIATRS